MPILQKYFLAGSWAIINFFLQLLAMHRDQQEKLGCPSRCRAPALLARKIPGPVL